MTLECDGSVTSAGLDKLLQALLWDKSLHDDDNNAVNVYRMKVSAYYRSALDITLRLLVLVEVNLMFVG